MPNLPLPPLPLRYLARPTFELRSTHGQCRAALVRVNVVGLWTPNLRHNKCTSDPVQKIALRLVLRLERADVPRLILVSNRLLAQGLGRERLGPSSGGQRGYSSEVIAIGFGILVQRGRGMDLDLTLVTVGIERNGDPPEPPVVQPALAGRHPDGPSDGRGSAS
eukprot:scaffold17011_cov62-Phaeocystis_antarctica.AAC.1